MKRYVYKEPKNGVRPISLTANLAVAVFDSVAEAEQWIQNQQQLAENDPYIFLVDPPASEDS